MLRINLDSRLTALFIDYIHTFPYDNLMWDDFFIFVGNDGIMDNSTFEVYKQC